MKDKKLLECLFGHHQYSKEPTKDRDGDSIYLCEICKRSGYCKWNNRFEAWYGYDKKGNCIHKRWDDGFESWYGYDKKGNCIHKRWSDGDEVWQDENGNWKAKNQRIGNMKFDEKYPNTEILSSQANNDDIMKGSVEKPCWHCKAPTAWVEMNFQAHLCSEGCVKAKWNEYARACRGEK